MFEFRELEAFVWIVKLGSFRMAAEHLHVTQPSVSERIARLEATLGEQILRRDHRPVVPTFKGRELFRQAEQLLENREDAMAYFQSNSNFSGVFKLGVAETIAQSWLPVLLNQLSGEYPHMIIELTVEGTPALEAKILNHELDLAFLMGPVNSDHLVNKSLCKYPLVFIAHPELECPDDENPVEFFNRSVLITFAKESIPFRDLNLMLDDLGIANPRIHCSSSGWTIARLTIEKTGIGVFSPIIVEKEIQRGELKILDLPFKLPHLVFTATWPDSHDSDLAEDITRLAVEISHLPPWGKSLK